jgi:2-succinyl-5-enolpyruvyl-6-hydroxy-3-cyclohexene-1-carboxylate synthase
VEEHDASHTVAIMTQATFCATLVDEWASAGLRHACIAPGSRSTPIALALAADARLAVHVFLDERSAAFAALGVGLATGRAALFACTSGTAAAHAHAAVVEADLSHIPLIVVTADRPPELRDVGAPQTIDQTHLYGRAVRWFHDPGVADDVTRHTWRSLAARAWMEARHGPVHVNLPFREPLVGDAGELPDGASMREVVDHDLPVPVLPDELCVARGVVVSGRGSGDVRAVAERLGWPILADARSPARAHGIARFDALLRIASFADAHRPDVVVRVGEPPASKVLSQWLSSSGATQVVCEPHALHDADRTASLVLRASRFDAPMSSPSADPAWRASWHAADARADEAIAASVTGEPALARAVTAMVPSGGRLVVASSMPVRDVEWYGVARDDIEVISNRGANGIDGVLATAIGVALDGQPTVAYLGDVAFVHDSSSLAGLARRSIDLTIVIVDNDGGAIFEFLPQRTSVPHDRYELLFGTPHGTDIATLLGAHRVHVGDELAWAPGVRAVVVRTDRANTVRDHDRIHEAVARSVGGEDS